MQVHQFKLYSNIFLPVIKFFFVFPFPVIIRSRIIIIFHYSAVFNYTINNFLALYVLAFICKMNYFLPMTKFWTKQCLQGKIKFAMYLFPFSAAHGLILVKKPSS